MKQTIFLVAKDGIVSRMTKNLPSLNRGEIVIKLHVEIAPDAMKPPTLERTVYVDNWSKGVDMDDVEFKKDVITEEEAAIILERRVNKMKEILEAQGFTVAKLETEE